MKIAIIGSGISGLVAAHHLYEEHDITVYESGDYIGGHTDTHQLQTDEGVVAVDSGFIVFNETNYPNFSRLLKSIGVASQNSDMSFSVRVDENQMEYNAANLNTLFCQRRNLFRPAFYRMLRDIQRFYRESPELLKTNSLITLGDYLRANQYSQAFMLWHLFPMASALWSAGSDLVEQFPARYLVAFMHNHNMLQVSDRPQWRTVEGGSSNYVRALIKPFKNKIRLNAPVQSIVRSASGITIVSRDHEPEKFDKVIIACHSDQALQLLQQPTAAESEVLGNIAYQENHMVLHSDPRWMPRHSKAWASWNVHVPMPASELAQQHCQVTYHMNRLQCLKSETDFFVTLNPDKPIDPKYIWKERIYHHPVYTAATLKVQKRHDEINGELHTFYCGAYWGWGFHEDGVRSALAVIETFNRQVNGSASHVQ